MNTPKTCADTVNCDEDSQGYENESVKLICRFRYRLTCKENLFLDCEIGFLTRRQVQGTFWNFLETSRGKSLHINPDAVQ